MDIWILCLFYAINKHPVFHGPPLAWSRTCMIYQITPGRNFGHHQCLVTAVRIHLHLMRILSPAAYDKLSRDPKSQTRCVSLHLFLTVTANMVANLGTKVSELAVFNSTISSSISCSRSSYVSISAACTNVVRQHLRAGTPSLREMGSSARQLGRQR